MTGRPVAVHAMRGISAHSNGFQTCRALHLLQLILGTVETPGGFRFEPPYPKPRRAAPEAAPQGHARLPARRPAAGLPARPGGPCPRRRRPAEAHRQGLHLGGAARCPRDAAHRDRQRRRAGPLPDRGAVPLHGQHGLELGDEHRRDHGDARPHRRFRRVRHPEDHRRRQLLVRDRRLRRPRAPRHHLPRAPRLHQPARPPDLRARRRHRLDPLAGRRARAPGPRGRPRLPVGAARPRRPPEASRHGRPRRQRRRTRTMSTT